MKKFACLCGGLAVLMMAQSAIAAPVVTTNGGLAIWYDVRGTNSGGEVTVAPVAPFTEGQSSRATLVGKKNFVENVCAGNQGGPGDGQVLRISPRLPLNVATSFGFHVTKESGKKGAFVDHSVGNIYAYITVEANGAGLDQVISALGRDTDVLKQGNAAAGNKIESILVTPDTAEWSAGGTLPSPSALATQVGDDFSMTAKSVFIPVTAGPTYDAVNGAKDAGVYRVACIQVTASTWNKGAGGATARPPDSTFLGNDKVNNLLMTRAVSSGGPAPAELPDFGYTTVNVGDVVLPLDGNDDFVTGSNGGTPEASNVNVPNPGNFTGVDIGASSIESDFDVVVQMKGDYNDDGTVDAFDITGFIAAQAASLAGTIKQRELYLGDFVIDGNVDAFDITAFNDITGVAILGNCTAAPLVDCLPSGIVVGCDPL